MGRFDGKVVVITGAGSGIGAATAIRFANEGANVVLSGRRSEKLQQTAKDLNPEAVLIVPGDVSSEQDTTSLIKQAVQRFDHVDVLVNNAGVATFGPFLKSSVEDFRKTMSIDVEGVFYMCRAALPELLKSHGSIVNVSSVSGLGGDWGMASYSAAKGAVSNLTRSLALEFGSQGVRINAVAPSLTLTEMTTDLEANPSLMAKFAERIPLGRGAHPEEIASVIAFLASDDAAFVNGAILPVDGGLSASNGQPNVGL